MRNISSRPPCPATSPRSGFSSENQPTLPAHRAKMTVLVRPSATMMMPSVVSCRNTAPFSGFTNCGRNARKNIAVFGFRTSASMPCRNASAGVSDTGCRPGAAGAFSNIAFMPRYIRYAAPRYLTSENRKAEARTMAEMPSTASAVWMISPTAMPRPVARPTRVPDVVARATVSTVAGPGMKTKPTTMAT